MIHILSLGAGVQSSTLALLAKLGVVTPMPALAIFADTGWEPKAVYDWLGWLEQQLPYPVVRVKQGDLRSEQMTARLRGKKSDGARWSSLPYFVRTEKLTEGRVRRQCTSEYKIQPIEKYLRREVLKLAPRQRAPRKPVISQWRGISADEAQRMKPSREAWYEVRYPLAMELGWTRGKCLEWMQQTFGRTPPRSACIGCPFHSDDEWAKMKPEEFADAVEFDHAIRKAGGARGESYLHRSLKPLGEIDFAAIKENKERQADLWGQECEGMCGV